MDERGIFCCALMSETVETLWHVVGWLGTVVYDRLSQGLSFNFGLALTSV